MFKRIAMLCLLLGSVTALAESLDTQLERGIYAEETTGDLDTAIQIYSEIIQSADNSKSAVSQAYFRLAMCQRKLGQTDKSKKNLEHIVAAYADQNQLVSKAKAALAELKFATLVLLDIPWQNNETLSYDVKSPAGGKLGALEYTATELNNGAWRLQSYTVVPLNNMFQYSQVEASGANFSPVDSHLRNSIQGDGHASYENEKIELKITLSGGKEQTRHLTSNDYVYDNEQIFHLLRRLPLDKDYKASFKVLSPLTGNILPASLMVEGSEKVTIGLGTYDTYRVKLNLPPGGSPVPEQTFWISKDASRYVVKYHTSLAVLELSEVTVRGGKQRPSFDDESVGLSLTLPQSWRILESDAPNPGHKPYQFMLPNDMEVQGIFASQYFDVKSMKGINIDAVVKGDLIALKNMLPGYKLLKEPQPIKVGNLSAKHFTGEYLERDEKLFEYRVYTLGEKGVYWFVFRGPAEKISDYQEDINKIITEFTAK